MKMQKLSAILVLALAWVSAHALAAPVELFVAANGNDARDGRSLATAMATIGRARDEIRRMKSAGALPAGGVTVQILGGKYSLENSLEFTAADSGSADAPIVYRAFRNQPVQILGGRVLSLTEFSVAADPRIIERLDPAARGKVRCAPIGKLGLKHAGPFPPVFSDSGGIFELFWNGKRLPLSRWPNEGWTTMKRAVVNGDNKTPGVFEFRDDRPARWVHNQSVWLKGQWRVPWEDPAIRVAKIDAQNHTITFAAGIPNGIGNKYTRPNGNEKEPWCAVNLIEEIDQLGEWAIDFDTQTLFIWLPEADGELMVSQLDGPLISVNGAAHVQFAGLTFEASLGDGIVLKNAESDVVAGCTIRNLAKRGIVLNGYRSRVQSCDIYRVGEGCILVSGGDKKKLVRSENAIVNNHLHDYAVLKAMYSAAVDVGFGGMPNGASLADAVGVRVSNNLIHDGPRDAVLVSGQDNVFEFNEILNCGFGSGDVGAFYSWLDWTIRGVIIRYNFIHDTVGGVNPDDGASGSFVFGNVFAGDRTGVWIASGPDHAIVNNIFVKDEGPVFGMDDRGVSRGYATNPKLHKPVIDINPAQPPWSVRFPEMVDLLQSHPELPLRTKFERNLVVMKTGQPFSLKMSKERQKDVSLFAARDNWITAGDPGFVDAGKGNFALKPDSIVFKQIPGFQPIPFEKIGLYKDEFRATLPTDAEAGRDKARNRDRKGDKNFGT